MTTLDRKRASRTPLVTCQVRVGVPFYSTAWGRWMVPLGGRAFRTATTTEIDEHTRTQTDDGRRLLSPAIDRKGERWQHHNV